MLVNAATLDALRVGFKTSFQNGLGQAPSQYERIATIVPASTKEVKYGWLGKIPNVREWIGARAVQNLSQSDYSIKEKPWELTLGVDRDDIETDNLGIYAPLFQEMGLSAGSKWDMLSFGLLKAGFTTNCYDGQFFFDTDHPVLDADGNTITVSNTGGGAGTPWYLLNTTRALKPIILQRRRDFEFVSKTKTDDDHVFMNREFLYGTDARANVGFGFWQMAYGSKQTLDATNYASARTAMMGMKGDYDRPLGITPNLLVVPPALEGAANRLMKNEQINGSDNEWKGTAEVLVVPWLA